MDKRWHVCLEQKLSEFMTKRYDMVIAAKDQVDAINGVLDYACTRDSLTRLLPFTIMHVIRLE